MIIVIKTEEWKTKKGVAIKAVARNQKGQLLGATNQTAAIAPVVVGVK